jgi:hypothetical protein
MTLVISKGVTLRQTYIGTDDPDAAAYITAVEAADGQSLENAVRVSIHSFVKGCKADGIWSAIKASCILAGARTLNGALVPLVGTAPTRFGTEVGWNYNRKTGLAGNGTNNYLSSNTAANASPVLNNHLGVYATSLPTVNFTSMTGSDASYRLSRGNGLFLNSQNHSTVNQIDSLFAIGFIGTSRSAQSSFVVRGNGSSVTASRSQDTTATGTISMFATGASAVSNSRLSFYSIGESLNLTLLDARVTDLMNAIGAAIP